MILSPNLSISLVVLFLTLLAHGQGLLIGYQIHLLAGGGLDQLDVGGLNVGVPLLFGSLYGFAGHLCLQHCEGADSVFVAKGVAAKDFVLDTGLGLIVIYHGGHVLVADHQSALYRAEGHAHYGNAAHTYLLQMACEVNVVVAEAFGGYECAVNVHGFYGLAYAAGYVELFAVDLRRTYEYYAAEVDLGIGQALENQGLSPVMAGHFLGSGADAGEGMYSAVQYLKRIADYGDVAQVYVRLAAQHADRLHGEKQIVVHSALAHDLLDDNHLLLVGMTLLLKGLGGDNQTLVQLLQSNADLLGDDVGSVVCSFTYIVVEVI